MSQLKLRFNKILFFIHSRINFFICLVSVISLVFVFLNLIEFNEVIGISNLVGLEFIFQFIVVFSSIFVILFLPSYPIFFIILKRGIFTVLEKLGLTIVVNSAFFIFLGYFGYWVGVSISGFLFFFGTVIPFLIIICYIVFFEFKKETYVFFKPKNHLIDNSERLGKFSLFRYLKNKITLNSLLIIAFLFLICIPFPYSFKKKNDCKY